MDDYGYGSRIARNASQSAYPNLWRGLVGLWAPSVGVQGNLLTDFSGGGLIGTLTNGPTWAPGRSGASVRFDGSNDFALIPDSSRLRPTRLTVSAWVNPTTTGNGQTIVAKDKATGQSYMIAIGVVNAGSVEFVCYNGSWISATASASNLTAGKWNLVTGTYDGTNMRLYVNGKLLATTALGSLDYTTPRQLTFARYYNNNIGTNYLNGRIDDVRIYNRALSAIEIMATFKGASPLVRTSTMNRQYSPPVAATTANFWPFF